MEFDSETNEEIWRLVTEAAERQADEETLARYKARNRHYIEAELEKLSELLKSPEFNGALDRYVVECKRLSPENEGGIPARKIAALRGHLKGFIDKIETLLNAMDAGDFGSFRGIRASAKKFDPYLYDLEREMGGYSESRPDWVDAASRAVADARQCVLGVYTAYDEWRMDDTEADAKESAWRAAESHKEEIGRQRFDPDVGRHASRMASWRKRMNRRTDLPRYGYSD